jgi:hypothetical protein
LGPFTTVGDVAGQVCHGLSLPRRQHLAADGHGARHSGIPCGDGPLLADRFAGHQPITQAGHGGNDHLVAVAGDGMGGECHARRGRVHHRLHQDCHPDRAASVPLVVRRDSL